MSSDAVKREEKGDPPMFLKPQKNTHPTMSMSRRSSETPLCDIVIDTFVDLHRRRQTIPFVPPGAALALGNAAVDPYLHLDMSLCRCVETIVQNECLSRRYSHEASMFDKGLKFVSECYAQLYKLISIAMSRPSSASTN